MIRLGIVGLNYGRAVLLPAFSADPRCAILGLAGSDDARAATAAREAGVKHGFGHWQELVAHPDIDAVAIAVPPALQAEIALAALKRGLAVFAEKPLAADLAGARAMRDQAIRSGRPTMVDFEFPELPSWQRAKAMLDDGAIGALRHVVVSWQVENAATRQRLRNWKTLGGGGILGNFVSHCFHYIEYFCGPLAGLSARLSGLPGEGSGIETTAVLGGGFASGAALSLTMSCASYLGSGHRIEFYGEDGTLMLVNTDADYMRGFALWHAGRPATALQRIEVSDPLDDPKQDGRIAPVSRLVTRFLDAIEQGSSCIPNFAAGYRAQYLIDAARRSHDSGRFVATPVEEEAEALA